MRTLPTLALATALVGCRPEPATPAPPDTATPAVAPVEVESGVRLPADDGPMTPEELAAARRMAGHDSLEQIAAENARMFEPPAREYIAARMPEYRKLLTDLRALLDEVEAQAPSWDSERAYQTFEASYSTRVATFIQGYDRLTDKGEEGGATQVKLGEAARAWQALNAEIGPGVATDQSFTNKLADIRAQLDTVGLALDDIQAEASP